MSQYFQQHIGTKYNPNLHWTSRLRARAGHDAFDDRDSCASFTFAEHAISARITELLAMCGEADAISGCFDHPVYHFDIAVMLNEDSTSFHLNIAQLDRVSPLECILA